MKKAISCILLAVLFIGCGKEDNGGAGDPNCSDTPYSLQAQMVDYPDGEKRKSLVHACENDCMKVVPTDEEDEDKAFLYCE